MSRSCHVPNWRQAFARWCCGALLTGALGVTWCTGCTADRRVNHDSNSNENQNTNANANENNNSVANDNGSTNGAPFVEVPNPLSGDNPAYPLVAAAVPAPGASVPDARLGTAQTRVVQTEGLRHEYSRHDPFNVDQSLIVLYQIATGEWRVYRTATLPYDQTDQLLQTVNLEEPRWDPHDANLLWGSQEFRILTLNVLTGVTTTVKDFAQDATIAPLLAANPDLYRITMKDEGETSSDKRHWAFILQGTAEDYRAQYLFCWDREQDAVEGVRALSTAESRIDWIGMSPSGTWVVVGGDWDNGGDLGPGLLLANRALTEFHPLFPSTAHGDVGLDRAGREVYVQQNASEDTVDLIPLEPGGERIALMRLFYDSESPIGLNSGVHVSCNFPGYCVVSTNIPSNAPEQNWLDRSIVLVTLDPNDPRVYYLAKVYGTTDAFWEETQAAMSHDGAKVIWATNWNQHVGDEQVWDMLLEMPAGWVDALNP